MKKLALIAVFALAGAQAALWADGAQTSSSTITDPDYDPLDAASPEDFLDIPKPGVVTVTPPNPIRVLPPEVVVPPNSQTAAPPNPFVTQPPVLPPSALPPAIAPAAAFPFPQSVLTLPPVTAPFSMANQPLPGAINLGVYINDMANDGGRRVERAALANRKTYTVEARTLIGNPNAVCRDVVFKLQSNAHSSYLEYNNVLVGYEWKAPWIFDTAKNMHCARVTLNADSVTALRQMDRIIASCEGLNDGLLEFEVLPRR